MGGGHSLALLNQMPTPSGFSIGYKGLGFDFSWNLNDEENVNYILLRI